MDDSGMLDQSSYRVLLDAIPSPVLIVEEDVRIVDLNTAASELLLQGKEQTLHLRGGDALHCVYANQALGGCGCAEFCKDCKIRNSVNASLQGRHIIREKMKVELRQGNTVSKIYLLITTAPLGYNGRKLVLLILEDISEIVALREILPICAKCKKIRDDKQYWHILESYLATHLDVSFTHSLCPECKQELFPAIRNGNE